jgi:hypothetical protein
VTHSTGDEVATAGCSPSPEPRPGDRDATDGDGRVGLVVAGLPAPPHGELGCVLGAGHPPHLATRLGLADHPVVLVLGGAFTLHLAVIAVIAWRTHRDQKGFDNNLRLLELLIAALPWRRGPATRRLRERKGRARD